MANEPVYEVWALGYDRKGNQTEIEVLLTSYDDKDEAIEYAKQFEMKGDLTKKHPNIILTDDDVIEIRVETTVETSPEYFENIDTVYSADLEF